jgi:hypothetical protein
VNSLDLIINSFQTPEASPSQCCSLKIGVHTITPSLKSLPIPACGTSFTLHRQHKIPKIH